MAAMRETRESERESKDKKRNEREAEGEKKSTSSRDSNDEFCAKQNRKETDFPITATCGNSKREEIYLKLTIINTKRKKQANPKKPTEKTSC
jgi:hypothetical protein